MSGKKLLYQTFEEWEAYGLNHGFNRMSPTAVQKDKNHSGRAWYRKGGRTGWNTDFPFKLKREPLPYQTFEEWCQFGMDHGYDERNPKSLDCSNNREEKSWYDKGTKKKWLPEFEFKRRARILPYKTLEQWKQYGIEHGYDKRYSGSFQNSDELDERSWYAKGSSKRWLSGFSFKTDGVIVTWDSEESWRTFGLEHSYDRRNVCSFIDSEDKTERSWYGKGRKSGWMSRFEFVKLIEKSPWQSFEEWYQCGIDNGYDQRHTTSLQRSMIKAERSWHKKGHRKGWLKKFNFIKIFEDTPWETKEEWIQYGIDQGYDKKRSHDIRTSSDDFERKWFWRGNNQNWLNGFDFHVIKHNKPRHSSKRLQSLLESYVVS